MIEVQIKDNKLYEKYKNYASYSSDYTHVCQLRDEMYDSLLSDGVEVDKDNLQEKVKPVLTIQGRRIMKINHATPEMLYYLGIRTLNDTTIANQDMMQIYNLVSQDLIDIDDKFKNVYSYLGYRNKVNELICSTLNYRDAGKLIDQVDGTATIQSMKLPEIVTRDIPIQELDIMISDKLIDYKRTWIITGKTKSGENVRITFYNKPQVLKSIAFPGHQLRVASPKIEFTKGTYYMTDPLILPEGLKLIPYKGFKSPFPRKILSLHFLNAYWEFKLRHEFGNK